MAENAKKAKAPAKSRKASAKKNPAILSMTAPAAKAPSAEIAKPVSHDDVARLAHRFWSERGFQHGHHEEDWFRAERELRARAS